LFEDVIEYYGYSSRRRDASVGLHTVLAKRNTFDSIRGRYESIQTVIKPTQKEEGQLGGQSLLHWFSGVMINANFCQANTLLQQNAVLNQ
jgi:hypothetical protein